MNSSNVSLERNVTYPVLRQVFFRCEAYLLIEVCADTQLFTGDYVDDIRMDALTIAFPRGL